MSWLVDTGQTAANHYTGPVRAGFSRKVETCRRRVQIGARQPCISEDRCCWWRRFVAN